MMDWVEIKLTGSVDDLISTLSALPAEVRVLPVRVFDDGSTTDRLSIEVWPGTSAAPDQPALIIDCA